MRFSIESEPLLLDDLGHREDLGDRLDRHLGLDVAGGVDLAVGVTTAMPNRFGSTLASAGM